MKHAKKLYMTSGLILALAFTGCSNQSEEKTAEPAVETQKTVSTGAITPEVHESAMQAPVEPKLAELKGTVAETFDSGGYTYIQLDTGTEKVWAAIGQAKVTAGEEIALLNGPVMQDFYSKTLDRTFPKIIFSSGIKGAMAEPHAAGMMTDTASSFADAMNSEGAAMTAPMMEGAQMQSGGSIKAVTPVQEVSVEKIEGGHTVEEIYGSVADLAGQKVKIRGKVIKVSPNIMGRTWIHLQDGTGNAMNNSHDLVVTSTETPEADSIIVVEGVVAKDKDFGAGYFYNVIMEEAVISH